MLICVHNTTKMAILATKYEIVVKKAKFEAKY